MSCFIRVLKVSLRLTLIQNGGLCPLRLLPLMTEFSVFMLLQGITPWNSWLGGISLKDCKISWKTRVKEMKTKFNCKWIKWTDMVKTKRKDFIDVVPIMTCQNSSWIIGSRIYGEGTTQIPLISPTTIDPLAQDPG